MKVRNKMYSQLKNLILKINNKKTFIHKFFMTNLIVIIIFHHFRSRAYSFAWTKESTISKNKEKDVFVVCIH